LSYVRVLTTARISAEGTLEWPMRCEEEEEEEDAGERWRLYSELFLIKTERTMCEFEAVPYAYMFINLGRVCCSQWNASISGQIGQNSAGLHSILSICDLG